MLNNFLKIIKKLFQYIFKKKTFKNTIHHYFKHFFNSFEVPLITETSECPTYQRKNHCLPWRVWLTIELKTNVITSCLYMLKTFRMTYGDVFIHILG